MTSDTDTANSCDISPSGAVGADGSFDEVYLDPTTGDTAHPDCETVHRNLTSNGYISVFTFGTLPERVIFDPISSPATMAVDVTTPGANTWKITYTETSDIAPVTPCAYDVNPAPVGKDVVICSVSNAEFTAGMEVWLGGGNSTFTPNANITAPFLVHPEGGTNTVSGAAGADEFDGAAFASVSTINTFHGMVGADRFIGGPGLDYVSYATHPDSGALTGTQEFRMSMDCVANDGYLVDGNRGDNVGCTANGIEGILGSNSRDVITGDAGDNTLYGGAGNDLIDGGAGSDFIKGQGDHDHLTGGAGADRTYGDDFGTTSTGSDTLIVNDGVADVANDCGPAEDAITYDAGLDTSINCENLTPPATTTPPTPTPPTPPAKDPNVPVGWTKGATIPPATREFTFPVDKYNKQGITFEAIVLALAFTDPTPPEMKLTTRQLSFSQLPKGLQDDDIEPNQFVSLKIKSGSADGSQRTIRWTDGQPLPEVEIAYYDPTKGAPANRSCPANGELKTQGGTFNLFNYVEGMAFNDAMFWLNRYGCRIDGAPTLVRSKQATYATVSRVNSARVRQPNGSTQRVVKFTKTVPVQEELRIELAPDYTLQSTDLTLTVADKGTVDSSLKASEVDGLTAASNTQRVGVHVLEASTGRLVPGARVDLVNEDGKVINSFDQNIARPTKRGAAIAYADKHMRTNDVGYTRLTFQIGKPGTVWVHAWVESPTTGLPVAERWLPVAVHNRGTKAMRSLIGVKYESNGQGSVIDGKIVPRYVISKKQETGKAVGLGKVAGFGTVGGVDAPGSTNPNARILPIVIGVAVVAGVAAIYGALDDNPAVVAGAPGAANLGATAEKRLTQDKPASVVLAEGLVQSGNANVAAWDGGGTTTLDIKNGLVGNDGGTLVAAGGGNLVAAGGGNLVAASGGNMVAAGGGNLVAAGGGNLVAAGGGNMVAAGAGNMVAAGGGNMVAAGGGNIVGKSRLARRGVAIDWLEMLRRNGRSAADGKGTAMDEIPVNVLWLDEDTSVLVGASGVIPPGVLIHLENRGVPVNYSKPL